MKIFKAIAKYFRLKRKKRTMTGNFTYEECRYISKKGGDIIPGDIPIPVSDELQSYLFKTGSTVIITMCIFEEILWFIPWHYYEYIVWLKDTDIDYDNCTAETIIKWMDECTKWNQRDLMRPDDSFEGGNFIFFNMSGIGTHSFSTDNGDYLVMRLNRDFPRKEEE